MTAIILWLIVGIYVGVVIAWLVGSFLIWNFRNDHSMEMVPFPDAAIDGQFPSLMVYVAAHNEAKRIESCIERLVSQNYPDLKITIVDDRSVDATSDIVRRMMVNNDQIQLIEVDRLPEGWIGKTHALSVATGKPHTDYLLFIDCDCELAPGAVQAIMQKVMKEELEYVSLCPMLELASPAEKLVTPAVSWLLGLYTVLGTKNGGDSSQVVAGNGQFILFSRATYEKVGGHSSVKAELAEDYILARKVDELGVKRWVGWGKGLYLSKRDNNMPTTSNATARVVIGNLIEPLRVFNASHVLFGGIASSIIFGLPAAVSMWIWPELIQLKIIAACMVLHLVCMRYSIRHIFKNMFVQNPSVFSFALGGLITGLLVLRASWIVAGHGTVRWGRTNYRVRGSRIVAAVPAPAPAR